MSSDKRQKLIENIIYMVLWIIIFTAPVLALFIRNSSGENRTGEFELTFSNILETWKTILPFFALFLVNNFIAAKLFFEKGKRKFYFIAIVCALIVFPGISIVRDANRGHHRHNAYTEAITAQFPAGRQTPPPTPSAPPRPPHEGMHPDKMGEVPPPPPMLIDRFAVAKLTMALLVVIANLIIKWSFRSRSYEQRMVALEKENLEVQLQYLKYQINPHFFMNTLNNIHALVDIEPERAKSTIVELSKLLRYVLYEGKSGTIALDKEIEFIKQYISIMKIRCTDQVRISQTYPSEKPDAQVPQLLFVSYIENAFKYGVSYEQESFIDVSLTVENDKLHFRCYNSKRKDIGPADKGGIGMENAQQRLGLLYGEDYQLSIKDLEDTYEVNILLPLKTLQQK